MEEIKTIELSNRFFKLVTILIVGIVVSYLGTLLYEFKSLPQNYPQEISVSGEGKAYAKPDIATVNLGMNTQGLKSQDAVDKNNIVINAVVKSIKDLGVDDKDIQTILYNLAPVYDYTKKGRVFKGYSLDQRIQVKIRNFDKISDILDKATSSGANTVGDLQFTIDNPETVKAEARAKAIAKAKQKALTLVSQAGLKIEKLVNISEEGAPGPMPLYGLGGEIMKESVSVAPQIETGQLEVNSTVTLTYRVR